MEERKKKWERSDALFEWSSVLRRMGATLQRGTRNYNRKGWRVYTGGWKKDVKHGKGTTIKNGVFMEQLWDVNDKKI